MLAKLGIIGLAVSVLSSLGPIVAILKLILALLQITLYPLAMYMLSTFKMVMLFLLRWLIIPVYKWLQKMGVVKKDPTLDKLSDVLEAKEKAKGPSTFENMPQPSAMGAGLLGVMEWADWLNKIDWEGVHKKINDIATSLGFPPLTWDNIITKALEWKDWISEILGWDKWVSKVLEWKDWVVEKLTWANFIAKALEWKDWLKEVLKWDDWVDGIISWFDWIPKLNWHDFISGVTISISRMLGRAGGGSVVGGTSYVVGEKGPEIFTPGSSGDITPNNKLGGGTTLNITGNTFGNRSDIDYLVSEIEKKLYINTRRAGAW